MTDLEFRAMLYLKRIRYASGIWHGDRARWLHRLCQSDALWRLTFAERVDLWFLIWHYRAQVHDLELVARANEEVNGQKALAFEIPPQRSGGLGLPGVDSAVTRREK